MEAKGLIVGIDPGTTTAIAVLDLHGNLLGVKSKKSFTRGEQVHYIQNFGQPIKFAVDTAKIPSTVEKTAAAFNIGVETPEKDLPRKEKSFIAAGFLQKHKKSVEDYHGVSALVAAIVCYNKYENKFRQVERQLTERGLGDRIEEVKRKVLKGISVNRVLEGRP